MFKLNITVTRPVYYANNVLYTLHCLMLYLIFRELFPLPPSNEWFPDVNKLWYYIICYSFTAIWCPPGGSFNRALLQLTALPLHLFIFIAFSTALSPSLSRSICNVSMLLLFMNFLSILQLSDESLIVDYKYVGDGHKWAQNGTLRYPWYYSDFLSCYYSYCKTEGKMWNWSLTFLILTFWLRIFFFQILAHLYLKCE